MSPTVHGGTFIAAISAPKDVRLTAAIDAGSDQPLGLATPKRPPAAERTVMPAPVATLGAAPSGPGNELVWPATNVVSRVRTNVLSR